MTDKTQSKQSRTQKNGIPPKADMRQTAGQPSMGTGTPKAKSKNKTDKVITLLQQSGGATLDELVAATGWQPHTTRAALTGLKKKGHVISSEKVEEVRRYRLGKPQ